MYAETPWIDKIGLFSLLQWQEVSLGLKSLRRKICFFFSFLLCKRYTEYDASLFNVPYCLPPACIDLSEVSGDVHIVKANVTVILSGVAKCPTRIYKTDKPFISS